MPGKDTELLPMSYLHSAFVDEEYLVMGSHVEEAMVKRILNHEFVDFAKLLPRDKIRGEDDDFQHMELINKGGMTYWSLVSSKEVSIISSFAKLEVAFRVFSNIYTSEYPHKSTELLQYSHVIYTASLMYVWEKVYLYDREFRHHMSHHPGRNWSIILQQAWNLRLKDKLKFDMAVDRPKGKSTDECKHFNRGKCNLGSSCRYKHRCLGCGKFGHGMHICRKKNNKNEASESHDKHKAAKPGTSRN